MKLRKTLSTLGLMLAFSITLPVVHADDWNQATRFTFSQPVQIPWRVLSAGTYFFRLADSNDRHLVQIFREDRSLVTTLYSVPQVRNGRDVEVAITLANRGKAQPQAIVAWFFAGETEGHEFLYPNQEKHELAHAAQKAFVSGD
ncbi:MAG: hypothetical protein WAN14_05390 [Candidatus Acidiferrales bacterium]